MIEKQDLLSISVLIVWNDFNQVEKLFWLLNKKFVFDQGPKYLGDFPKGKEFIKNTRPEVLLLDSSQNCDEDLRRIQEVLALDPWVYIVLLIDQGMKEHGDAALACGACAYLVKERISFKTLQETFTTAFERTKAKENIISLSNYGALGGVASGVAHNINNKLTLLSLLLLDGKSRTKDPKVIEIFEKMESVKDSCASINREVLSYLRRPPHHLEVFSLFSMLNQNLALMERLLDGKINLKISSIQEAKVKMTPCHFDQIIFNLIMNAKQALRQAGTVEILVSTLLLKGKDGAGAGASEKLFGCLEVRDDGPGMSSEVKAKIFNPFFTTKEREEGSGIGLSTVFEIVQKYDGMIEVESNLGVGTIFKIFIPAEAG